MPVGIRVYRWNTHSAPLIHTIMMQIWWQLQTSNKYLDEYMKQHNNGSLSHGHDNLLFDGLEITIRNNGIERILACRLEQIGNKWQRTWSLGALGWWRFLHHFRLCEPSHALKILHNKLSSAVLTSISPRSHSFVIKHPVAETYNANSAGTKNAVDFCKHLLGLL